MIEHWINQATNLSLAQAFTLIILCCFLLMLYAVIDWSERDDA